MSHDHTHPRLVEQPGLYPCYIYAEPPGGDDVVAMRGGPVFDFMAETGFEVRRIPAGVEVDGPFRNWTVIYVPVPSENAVPAIVANREARLPVSVVMDVHFPIMRMEQIVGSDEAILATIEARDVMLANLAVACAVTVSQPDWAADLAAINPRVWHLPDLDEADEQSVVVFIAKFGQMVASTMAACRSGHPDGGHG